MKREERKDEGERMREEGRTEGERRKEGRGMKNHPGIAKT